MATQHATQTHIPETAPRGGPVTDRFSDSGAAAESAATALHLMGPTVEFARNAEIYGEGEPADYLYRVVRGAARTYRLLHDGRRQIGAFYLPGDVFGLEIGDEHSMTAEAVVDSTIVVIKRTALVALASQQSGVAQELWAMTARELAKAQSLMLTLGRKTAQERVAAFLLEMASRAGDGRAVELPMSRQDIADYLGLTMETVSRTLARLAHASAISLSTSRRIVLRQHAMLHQLNS